MLTGPGRAVVLTRSEAVIFDIVWRAKGHPVRTASIADALYAHDPNGGPLKPGNMIAQSMHRVRPALATLGVAVRGAKGIGQYRLVIEAVA